MMTSGACLSVRNSLPIALVILAGGSTASAGTFAPGTSEEYVKLVRETLRQRALATQSTRDPADPAAQRFVPAVGRRLVSFADEREFNPADRDHEIWWSYAPDGLNMEPSNATLFHSNLGLAIGQTIDPLDPEFFPGIVDNFQSVLFQRLNGLPRPYGFAQDGGQRTWQTIVANAFCRWGAVSGIEFRFIPGNVPICPAPAGFSGHIADQPNADGGGPWDRNALGHPTGGSGGEGDIRIAMVELDGPTQPDGSTGGLLAWTYDPTLPPAADLIDDNDTPDDTNDDITNFGYCGNILLDREEKWNDPTTPNLFATVIVREIGFALGLLPTCPADPVAPYSVLQHQQFVNPGAQQPLPPLFFQEPQEDDIRAVQFLYGDTLEVNDIYTDAFDVIYRPVPGSNVFSFKPQLGLPESTFPLGPTILSISGGADIDRFRLGLPESVISGTLRVRVAPPGPPYGNLYVRDGFDFAPGDPANPVILGSCAGMPEANVDPSRALDLAFSIQAYDPFTNILQTIAFVNDTGLGFGEEIEVPVTTGTYFITVGSLGGLDVQLYELDIEVTTPLLESGIESADYLNIIEIDSVRDEGIFGTNAVIGVVDGQHVAGDHDVFFGRDVHRVNWPGIEPAATSAGSHSTTVAGVAAGAPIGGFEGLAPEAQLASATVATQVYPDGTFAVGKSALYFALLGLTDPSLSATLGLPAPATVLVSTFGGGGRTLTGEDAISQAFDVVSSTSNATFVLAAGNNGQAEGRSFPNCPITGVTPDSPGAEYLGSRSVIPPATSYNAIVVGGVGIVDSVSSPAEFADTPLVVAGFSSRGPIDSANVTTLTTSTIIDNARPGVDIVAPATGVVTIPRDFSAAGPGVDPCDYNGPIPQSLLLLPSIEPGDDPDAPADPGYFGLIQGTSVAAGIVAGAVALLQDAGLEQDPPLSIHPSVMKAILLNGAEKMEGWTNLPTGPGRPQDQRDGFQRNPALAANPDAPLVYNLAQVTTTNPLDRAQGAGVLNLKRSLEIYLTGYPPADPPQADFEGPTIDPPETNPLVPTIRIPLEPPTGMRGIGEGFDDFAPEDHSDQQTVEPPGPDDLQIERLMDTIRGYQPSRMIVTPLQAGTGRQPDIRNPHGNNVGQFTTGPQTPYLVPTLDDGTTPNPPGTAPPGIPGAVDAGVRPREIQPLFVHPIGWDHANIDQRAVRQFGGGGTLNEGYIDYIINVPLLAARPDPANPGGSLLPADRLTVTLCWQRLFTLTELNFSNPNNPRIGTIQSLELENLDLQLFACDSLGNIQPGAAPTRASASRFYTTEHIFTDIPLSSLYLIRVRWTGTDYDTRSNQPLAEQQYGIAWRVDFSPRPEALRPTGVTDLVNVLSNFGGAVGNERYSLPSDIDANGRIDWKDILVVLRNWGG